MNKLYGLKKLREIAKHLHGIAHVSPFKVYEKPGDYREVHARGKQRILIRTDEKGKRYVHHDHAWMPRRNVTELTDPKVISGVMREMKEMRKVDLRFIVHPTNDRAAIYCEGKVKIEPNSIWIELGDLALFYDAQMERITNFSGDSRKKTTQQLVQNIEKVVQTAVRSGQVKQTRNRTYTLCFLSWKSDPTVLELYDLKEFRINQKTPKGTKSTFNPYPYRGLE